MACCCLGKGISACCFWEGYDKQELCLERGPRCLIPYRSHPPPAARRLRPPDAAKPSPGLSRLGLRQSRRHLSGGHFQADFLWTLQMLTICATCFTGHRQRTEMLCSTYLALPVACYQTSCIKATGHIALTWLYIEIRMRTQAHAGHLTGSRPVVEPHYSFIDRSISAVLSEFLKVCQVRHGKDITHR